MYIDSDNFFSSGVSNTGPRAAYGPLDKFVRPFLLLSSFTPTARKFFQEGENFRVSQI